MDKNLIPTSIYERDWQSFLYEDDLRWSRIQTATVVEGATLLAISGTLFALAFVPQLILALFGFILVAIICLLALKDGYDANNYLTRIIKYEKQECIKYEQADTRLPTGKALLNIVVVLVTLFNFAVIVYLIANKGLDLRPLP